MAKRYGYVKCKVASEPTLKGTRRKREIQYHLHANLAVPSAKGGTDTWGAAINVGTNDSDDLLQYRLVLDFHHPLLKGLRAAPRGFRDLTSNDELPALDFVRSDILAETGPWRTSDLMDGAGHREPYRSLAGLLQKAHATQADVYIFGRTYENGDLGIRDVHMNQGSKGSFLNEGNGDGVHNDVWQDGAVLIDFAEPEWVAYFTAFTKQFVPTDDLGNPVDKSRGIANAELTAAWR